MSLLIEFLRGGLVIEKGPLLVCIIQYIEFRMFQLFVYSFYFFVDDMGKEYVFM